MVDAEQKDQTAKRMNERDKIMETLAKETANEACKKKLEDKNAL